MALVDVSSACLQANCTRWRGLNFRPSDPVARYRCFFSPTPTCFFFEKVFDSNHIWTVWLWAQRSQYRRLWAQLAREVDYAFIVSGVRPFFDTSSPCCPPCCLYTIFKVPSYFTSISPHLLLQIFAMRVVVILALCFCCPLICSSDRCRDSEGAGGLKPPTPMSGAIRL